MDTTQWSIVLGARDGDSEARRRSLELLCQIYWPPLYAYVRQRGYSAEDSKDLTQEFFSRVIERSFLKNVDKSNGRFRNFLLASMNHFLANEWHKKNAKKRGGGMVLISLDVQEVEKQVGAVASLSRTPEDIFRRNWALLLLERALSRLRAENHTPKRKARLELVEAYLSTGSERIPYAELERTSEISAAALKVSVHRLRQRYGELLRDEIRQTVGSEDTVDEELRELQAALSGRKLRM